MKIRVLGIHGKKITLKYIFTCRWGFTPAGEAERFGHTDVLAVLSTQKCNIWFRCTKIFTALSLENKYIKLLFHDDSFLYHLTLLIVLTYLPFGRLILWAEFINFLVRILSEKPMDPWKFSKPSDSDKNSIRMFEEFLTLALSYFRMTVCRNAISCIKKCMQLHVWQKLKSCTTYFYDSNKFCQ